MLKEKSVELIQELNVLIKEYASNDKVRKIIVEEFDKRNMKGSLAVGILNKNRELSTLDIDESKDLIMLFIFTMSMYNALTHKESEDKESLGEIEEILRIDPKNYFNEIEIENLNDYKFEKKVDKKDEVIIFPKMNRIAPGFYSGYISGKHFAELDAGNEFIYNFKTQRDPIIDVYGMKRIHLNKTNAKEIRDGVLSGDQFPTTIVVNVLKDGTDEIYYDEKSGDLSIISGTKNLVDGMHRKVGNSLAFAVNPDIQFNWLLVVTNYSEIRAQKYMVEINKQQKMKQEHIKNMDTASLGNVVVDAIKDIDTSEFADQIKDNDKEIGHFELEHFGMAKKSTLAMAIEECYGDRLTNKLQIRPIAKHIANVMDYIIGLHVEEFMEHPEATQKVSYINHKNMFAGYIALSERLYGVKKWEDILEEILDKIDFSMENPFWDDIKLSKESDMKKSTRTNLYKFFQKLI